MGRAGRTLPPCQQLVAREWASTLLVGLVMAAAGSSRWPGRRRGAAGPAPVLPGQPVRRDADLHLGRHPLDQVVRRGRAAGASTGPGSGFGALVVLMLLGGMAVTVWKLSTARRMAQRRRHEHP